MYSADESYAVYDEQSPTARKSHTCMACDEVIPKGARYYRVGTIYDGTVETIKRCVRCQRIHEHLRNLGGCYEWPDERLNCGHEYAEMHDCDPPDEISALAFAVPGETE